MSGQKAACPDCLHAELLKYGEQNLIPIIASLINTAVQEHLDISEVVGVGLLVPLAALRALSATVRLEQEDSVRMSLVHGTIFCRVQKKNFTEVPRDKAPREVPAY